jgi:lipoprotein-anchoring transpeptidase ErfK/SrfK
MIHGLPRPFAWLGRMHRTVNWTHGCIAVTNDEIDEIARVVPNGTPVLIEP